MCIIIACCHNDCRYLSIVGLALHLYNLFCVGGESDLVRCDGISCLVVVMLV